MIAFTASAVEVFGYRIERVKEVIAAAKKAGVKLQVGFNRRFDHNHRAVYEAVRAGKVGPSEFPPRP